MTTKKKYIVQNPRSVPIGTRIILFGQNGNNWEWFEGEEFVKPVRMSQDSMDDLVSRGFLRRETIDG